MNSKRDDLVGKIFDTPQGKLVITDYKNNQNVFVKFIETGFESRFRLDAIRSGQVKDKLRPSCCGVGYIGIGDHPLHVKRVKTPAYLCWTSMITRCYNKNHQETHPTYVNAEVCKEWHSFQVFADWFESNHPKDGKNYELDKDINSNCDKIYSPETCKFVSQKENTRNRDESYYKFRNLVTGEEFECTHQIDFCNRYDLKKWGVSKLCIGDRDSYYDWVLVTKGK